MSAGPSATSAERLIRHREVGRESASSPEGPGFNLLASIRQGNLRRSRITQRHGCGSQSHCPHSAEVKRPSGMGARRIDYHQAVFCVSASLCFGKLHAIEVQHAIPNDSTMEMDDKFTNAIREAFAAGNESATTAAATVVTTTSRRR